MHPSEQPAADERAATVAGYRPIDDLIPADWERGELSANGIRQSYYRTGGGRPPLVLLHGIMEGGLSWLPTARALADTYDLIMLDARGHGRSAPAGDDFSPFSLADDAAEAISALSSEPVRLLGFSMGASSALLLADRRPELVRALVLGGMPEAQPNGQASAGGNPMESPGYRAWYERYMSWLDSLPRLSHAERMQAGLSQLPPFAPLLGEDDYVAWIENCARLDPALARMGGQLWAQLPTAVAAQAAALERLTLPILIMQSGWAASSDGPLELSEQPSGRPNLRIVRFGNSGHVIIRDRFAAFVAQVRAFLAGV